MTRKAAKATKVSKAAKRRAMDNYPTPPQLARAITFALEGYVLPSSGILRRDDAALGQWIKLPFLVLEPSAGTGPFVNAVVDYADYIFGEHAERCTRITAIEPRKQAAAKIGAQADEVCVTTLEQYLKERSVTAPRFDLAIGNPPFSKAQQHIELLRPCCKYIALLLRMSFLGSQERARTLWAPPSGLHWVMPLAERPSFTGGKTDNSEYAVYIWEAGWQGPTMLLPHLFWKKES